MANLITSSKQKIERIQLGTRYLVDELIPIFLHEVQVSESSRRVYARSLKIFTSWLAENGIERIDRKNIIDYKNSLDSRSIRLLIERNERYMSQFCVWR